jgi:malic enzyme
MVDRKGIIWNGRTDNMNPYKQRFARDTDLRTLEQALDGADAFIGVSSAGLVTGDMIKRMARDPIVFAMANPVPEILPEVAKAARPDVLMATGRSDYPNQVNNVLGFPFIFRALDVRARCIDEGMKLAARRAASVPGRTVGQKIIRPPWTSRCPAGGRGRGERRWSREWRGSRRTGRDRPAAHGIHLREAVGEVGLARATAA